MPDPIETMLKTEAEVTRLWNQARPAADNRDVQAPDPLPMSSRVAGVRAAIADHHYITDDKINVAVTRLLDDLQKPSLAAHIDRETPAAEEEAEEKDRLIVLPRRGDEEMDETPVREWDVGE